MKNYKRLLETQYYHPLIVFSSDETRGLVEDSFEKADSVLYYLLLTEYRLEAGVQ